VFNVCDYYLSAGLPRLFTIGRHCSSDDGSATFAAALSAGCTFVLLNRVLLAARSGGPRLFASRLRSLPVGVAAPTDHRMGRRPDVVLTLEAGPGRCSSRRSALAGAACTSALLARRQAPERPPGSGGLRNERSAARGLGVRGGCLLAAVIGR